FTKPGIVYSFASMSAGRPNSRRVADVTGPIDAVCTPSYGVDRFSATRAPRKPSRRTKLRTVEELVKVMTCGLFSLERTARKSPCDDLGTTVSYASTTST